ncbi:MAG: bifunctional diguanylate cyclase/phosphodiesterase [Magnetococcales bacterium]|nr:bifunctional diguanylate cyclase/phosphodiesterase [Magnetococcales bacterium]
MMRRQVWWVLMILGVIGVAAVVAWLAAWPIHPAWLEEVHTALMSSLVVIAGGVILLVLQILRLFRKVQKKQVALTVTTDVLDAEIESRGVAEERIQSLARFPEENTNPVLRVGSDGILLYANSASDLLLRTLKAAQGEKVSGAFLEAVVAAFGSRKSQELSVSCDDRLYSLHLVSVLDADYVNVYGSDITEKARAEAEIRSLARFPEENANPVLRVDGEGRLIFANGASAPLLDTWKVQEGECLPGEWRWVAEDCLKCGSGKELELICGERTFSIQLAPVTESGYLNLYGLDVTERKYYEEQLLKQSNFDTLTELPNRALFQDRLDRALVAARSGQKLVAILFIGLDRFKEVNQALGRDGGDDLLKAVAVRLKESFPAATTVARHSGDVFAGILSGLGSIAEIVDRVQEIRDHLSESFLIRDNPLDVAFSIGVSVYPSDHREGGRLVHFADLAMFRAKADSRDGYRFYEGGMDEEARERHKLLGDLRRALEEEQFRVHYQPQMDLATGQLSGMEALVRWQHPERGMISPGRFIPLAEESGLIVPLGWWVLKTACRHNKSWQRQGLKPLRVAVNLSSVQFGEADLVKGVGRILEESGLDPDYLELEITESVAMHDANTTIATLKALHSLGLRLSIDDFGTGYSSLAYLKRFPVDKVKIDQSFVRDLGEDSESGAICNAVVQLGHAIRLKVIAEGVEEAPQLELLRGMGCDQIQGYHYSRPLAEEAFEAFLAKHGARK